MRTLIGCLILTAFLAGCHNVQVKPLDPHESAVLRQSMHAHWQQMEANAAPVETEMGEIYFELGRTELTESARSELTEIAERVNQNVGLVMIEGHADFSSDHDQNKRLGYMRALSAAEQLRNAGVWEERMVIKSFAETRPSADRLSGNERVIVRIFPQGGRMEGKSAEEIATYTLPQEIPVAAPQVLGFQLSQ